MAMGSFVGDRGRYDIWHNIVRGVVVWKQLKK